MGRIVIGVIVALGLAGAALGCGHEQAQTMPAPTVVSAQPFNPPQSICPLNVPGATIETEQTDDGLAMVFTTSEQSLYLLRQRVLELAQYYNRQNPNATTAPSTARVVYIDDGAKLILSPVNPADLATLRAQAQSRAQYMASTNICPTM